MGYTQDEIKAVVDKLMRSSVRYDVDSITGNRRIELTFSDVQEAAAATFVMFPQAPMYVAKLSSKRLAQQIANYKQELSELMSLVDSLNRDDATVTELGMLANTKSALMELEGVVASGAYKNLQAIPSYQRFAKNASAFLQQLKPAVVSNGDVVPSKSQAAGEIPGKVSGLPEQFSELFQNTRYFARALTDYTSLNLPNVLAESVVRRARQLVSSRYDLMSSMSDEEKQNVLRDAALEVLSSKGIISTLSVFEPPPEFPPATGTVQAYADQERELIPAQINTKQEPFFIQHGVNDKLHLEIDSVTTFDIDVPSVVDTFIEGYMAAPFSFSNMGTLSDVMGGVWGSLDFAAEAHFKVLLETTESGTYQKWDIDVTIPIGNHTEWDICTFFANEVMSKVGGPIFMMFPSGSSFHIFPHVRGPGYRITVLDGDANDKLGFRNGQQSAFGAPRNDQLFFTLTTPSLPTQVDFSVTFPSGMQTIEVVVDAINAARPTAVVPLLEAVAQQYTSNGMTTEYCRVVMKDQHPDAKLVVTSGPTANDMPNSGIGMQGEINHTKLTARRLYDFLASYEEVGPPVRKLSDYLKAVLVGDTVRLVSNNSTSTSSKLVASGTAAGTLFYSNPYEDIGRSYWLVMTSQNPGILEGDIVELHDTDTNWATVGARQGDFLLYTNLLVGCGCVYPFASSGLLYAVAIRGDRRSFSEVVSDPLMVQFLADDRTKYFSELQRYTNMMLADNNPTESEINTVLALLQSESSKLDALLALLASFESFPCRPIDDLFRTLTEKGSDKAVDVLLQCRFSEFFGLDISTSSYAGTISSGLQTVVQEDLPVAKFDRVKGARSIVASTTSTDYETDFSDTVVDSQKYSIDRQ